MKKIKTLALTLALSATALSISPTLKAQKAPSKQRKVDLAICLDTSGSMSADEIASACAEIRAIADYVEALHLVVADAKVQEAVELPELERWMRRGRARGGGGTDHRPVFAWVGERSIRPDLFIGMTDLYSRFPTRAPRYPVLWLVPEQHGKLPFGRRIVVR